MRLGHIQTIFGVATGLAMFASSANATLFTSAGLDAAAITPTVDAYRAALGTNNGGAPGPFASGRREINWDGVPDALSDPAFFPGDFFNANASPRARGATFSTPGTGLLLSADSDNPTATPRDFASISPAYAAQFEAFSQQRLFTPVGSNTTDVFFFVPGTNTPAVTRGFGAIFSDVDLNQSTFIDLFGIDGYLIERIGVPGLVGQQTFSFAGAAYSESVIAHARITTGNIPVTPSSTDLPNLGIDVVVMDDFIYGEPAVPEPMSALLVGLCAALMRRR